jgi:hypothetical protein
MHEPVSTGDEAGRLKRPSLPNDVLLLLLLDKGRFEPRLRPVWSLPTLLATMVLGPTPRKLATLSGRVADAVAV